MKKYIVRLSDEERQICTDIVKKLKGTSQKVRRAQMLLKADADGPAWRDAKIAEAFNCRVQTIDAPEPPAAGWPTGSEAHCHASGSPPSGLRKMDPAPPGG